MIIERTISAMVGKGSVSHNSRQFHAKNTDPERTHLNVEYCNEPIKEVYHRLFDESLEHYNARQTRADRKIEDYYEKIRSGKQEKPFHELIIQIGDKDNMSSTGEYAGLAKKILDEYYRDFQERNPYLYVFSAHLHMDEATPHLHIDFVPFVTGSNRGLDTRVSLKKALEAQGFVGGTRHETEWNQWVHAEKEALAAVMERHGVEWEQKGTHEKHLSVYDYEKKMRAQEVDELESKVEYMARRITNYQTAETGISEMETKLNRDPEYKLPNPPIIMSAREYKNKHVDRVVEKLKQLILNLIARYFKLLDDFMRINSKNGNLYRDNERLRMDNARLSSENIELCTENRNYGLLRRSLGEEKADSLIESEINRSKQRNRAGKLYIEGKELR